MARWIGDARAAMLNEGSGDNNGVYDLVAADCTVPKQWKPTSLAILFGGQKEPPSRLLPKEIDAELALMQALANLEEGKQLDDMAIEVDSDEEFRA
jgi:hypothetical protein